MADTCHLCGKPVSDEDASVYVPWPEHADRRVCVANIRADERERHGNNCRGMWDEWVHDLRAQVKALPQHEFLVGSPLAGGGWVQYAAAGVRRSDVLRLLEGESDG